MQASPILRLTSDLLDKLRHDLAAMRREPANAYPAYDFFATAWHMLDWVFTGEPGRRAHVLAASPLLQLCGQIVSGATQLALDVPASEPARGWGLRSAFRKPPAGELVVHPQGEAAETLGRRVRTVDLAAQLYKFWNDFPQLTETTVVCRANGASTATALPCPQG